MNMNQFTQKTVEALQRAQSLAIEYQHMQVEQEHLMAALLEDPNGLISQLLTRMGMNADGLRKAVTDSLGRIPRVSGPGREADKVYISPEVEKALLEAESRAKQMKDEYLSVEHVWLGICAKPNNRVKELLRTFNYQEANFLKALSAVRGATRVTSDNPEETYDALKKYGSDLVELARNHKLDPVIGRDNEIRNVIRILSRKTKNNPVLIGEPGVGKTAIAEGLALKIVKDEVPELLAGKKIVALDLTSMVAGTKYRGDFEERIKKAMDEVKAAKDVILFIDEVHTLIGAGAAEGAVDAANILKPALARGEIQVIGATTIDEYRKNIEKDAALERRFQSVMVGEPTEEEAVEILKGLRDKYEAHHKVKISDEAIENAVKMSSRYIADRFLPDKAIDLIDEAASRVRLKAFTAPPNLKSMEQEIKRLEQEKASAVKSQDFEAAAKLRDKQKSLQTLLDEEKEKWKNLSGKEIKEVTTQDIADVVSAWSGIPVTQLTEEESERLLNMEKILHERIVGQDKAVSAVARAIRRGRVGIKNPNRPLGSFIFLGPTGVGKTELCRALAEAMFGSEDAIIKLDMSEYMEKHTVSKLIGSPPGYVGFDEGGQLTEKIRRKPYSVVLFDEIEKAHPDVFNMLLQILEDGVLTDSKGRKVSFKNAVIIMTSNVGASKITNGAKSLGFGENGDVNRSIEELVTDDLKKTFKPEFLNRIDEIIVFNRLQKDDIKEIAKRMLKTLDKRLAEMDITLSFTDRAISAIADAGFDDVYGARPLRRAIQQKIEDPLSELMLEKKILPGGSYTADYGDSGFTFESANKSEASAEGGE